MINKTIKIRLALILRASLYNLIYIERRVRLDAFKLAYVCF